jgi:FkbM family methyltransferase
MTEGYRFEEISFMCFRGHFINTHKSVLPGRPIVVDAGAADGSDIKVWTEWMGTVPSHLFCIEPNKTNFVAMGTVAEKANKILREPQRPYDNVVFPIHAAVSGQRAPGTMRFTEFFNKGGKYSGWGSLKCVNDERARGRKEIQQVRHYKVSVYRINALFKKLQVPRIDVLKLDVEGSEDEIVRTMWPETAARIGQISFENHYPGKTEKYLKKLTFLGFDNVIQCRSEIHAYRRKWAQQVARGNKG